jgi:hypothetical membrane protein
MTAAVAGGVLLLLAGATILMGIITAEALYPDVYTTHDNEISDLGATRPPDSIICQPSATIFNSVMIVSGVAILLASGLLHRAFRARRVTIPMALLGIGVLGVGIFPGNNATFHPIFALMAFVSGGIAAVLSGHIQGVPARYLSRLLGVIALGAIVVGMAGESTVVFEEMGDGGVERWIAYPVVLWVTYFGGWLSASGSIEDPERHW